MGLQFATQVAQTLGPEKKNEVLDTNTVESPRLVQPTVLCPAPEIETVNSIDQVDDTNVNDVSETFIDEQDSIAYYNKETDINNVIDSYENMAAVDESITIETSSLILNNETVSVSSLGEIENFTVDDDQTEKSYSIQQESSDVSIAKPVSPDRTVEEESVNATIEENPSADDSDLLYNLTKNEGKLIVLNMLQITVATNWDYKFINLNAKPSIFYT